MQQSEAIVRRVPAQDMEVSGQRSATEVVQATKLVQEVLRSVMQDGQHYGKIPGCGDKPTLLKPGAEKLCMTFRLAAMPEIQMTDVGGGHREYRVLTKLVHIPTGDVWGVGVGVCSTMESKYRYRTDKSDDTLLDIAVPRTYWDAKNAGSVKQMPAILAEAVGQPGRYGVKKTDSGWVITKRGESTGGKVDNPDIADVYNTVLKMAKKRSLVDGALTATAASDIFTQDIEDLIETEERIGPEPAPPPQAKAAANGHPPPQEPGPSELDELAAKLLSCLQNTDKKWTGSSIADVQGAVKKWATKEKAKCNADYYRTLIARAAEKKKPATVEPTQEELDALREEQHPFDGEGGVG